MCTPIVKIPALWCVTHICSENKSLSSGLIHPNSIMLLYVSDSYLRCLKMACQKMPQNLGGKRPIVNKSVTIQRVSIDTIMRLLDHEAELSASNYDDDYGQTYKDRYQSTLVAIWTTMLMSKKDLDFRLPSCGITSIEVRKWRY